MSVAPRNHGSIFYIPNPASIWTQCKNLGIFCKHGQGSARECSNKVNSYDYLDVIQENVRPSMDFYLLNGNMIFQDDKARIHRAKNAFD